MECINVKEFLVEYIEGVLDEERKRFIDGHISQCKNCSEEFVSMQAYYMQMRALRKVNAPDDFLEKVHLRLKRRFEFEKITRALFIPVRIKVPVKLVVTVAMVFLVISVFNVIKPELKKTFVPIPKTSVPVVVSERIREESGSLSEKEKIGTKKEEVEYADIYRDPFQSQVLLYAPAVPVEGELYAPAPAESEILKKKSPSYTDEIGFFPETNESLSKLKEEPAGRVIVIKPKLSEFVKQKSCPEGVSRDLDGPYTGRTADFVVMDYTKEAVDMKEDMIPSAPLLIEVFFKIEGLMEEIEGSIISVEYENETALPHFVDVEVSSKNYNLFLEKLSSFVEIKQQTDSTRSINEKGNCSIRLEILNEEY